MALESSSSARREASQLVLQASAPIRAKLKTRFQIFAHQSNAGLENK
jgi:hypothetical protein